MRALQQKCHATQVHKSGTVSLNLYGFSDDFGPTEKLRKYEVDSLQ